MQERGLTEPRDAEELQIYIADECVRDPVQDPQFFWGIVLGMNLRMPSVWFCAVVWIVSVECVYVGACVRKGLQEIAEVDLKAAPPPPPDITFLLSVFGLFTFIG